MKFKLHKHYFTGALALIIVSAGTATADMRTDSATISVAVTITNPSCVLSAPDSVVVGDFGASDFQGVGANTQPVEFDVTLSECNVSGLQGQLQYSGTTDTDNTANFALDTGEGAAGGIALHLSEDSAGKTGISPGGKSEQIALPAPGENTTVKTYVSYIQTRSDITPGNANATLTIELLYL